MVLRPHLDARGAVLQRGRVDVGRRCQPTKFAYGGQYSLAAELAIKAAEGITKYGDAVDMIVDGQVVGSVVGAATLRSAVHGHGLVALFGKLQRDTQTGIAQEFNAATGEHLGRV